jgi:hypothetical protein
MPRTALLIEANPVLRAPLEHTLMVRGYRICRRANLLGYCQPQASACAHDPDDTGFQVILADRFVDGADLLALVELQRARGCVQCHMALMADEWPLRDRRRADRLGIQTMTTPVFPGPLDRWLWEVEQQQARVDAGVRAA